MRKSILFAIVSLVMIACSNEDEMNLSSTVYEKDYEVVTLSDNVQTKSSVGEDKILKFRDENAFQQTVAMLNSFSQSDFICWEQEAGFESLRTLFDQAMEDAADLDQTPETYFAFKAKYDGSLYFPEYGEDYGAYLPVSRKELTCVLNKNGDVMVGNDVRNYRDIEDYVSLQLAGDAYYEMDQADKPTPLYYSNGDYVDSQYDSGWTVIDDRKLKLKIGRRIYDSDRTTGYFLMKLHYEISFRKKTALGWSNYSSETTTNTTVTFDNSQTQTFSQTEEGKSSHDHYFTDHKHSRIVISLGNGEFRTTRINGSATISYRGFVNPVTYNFDMPGGFVFTNL